MIRFVSAVSVALLVLVSFELYNGVHRVKAQEKQLVELKAAAVREAEAMRVLKAEWSYLSQPDRLQALARRHLALTPTGAGQIVSLASLPLKGANAVVEEPSASPVIEPEDLPPRVVPDVAMPRPKPAVERPGP